jgi:hypothetical protein
MANPTVKIVRMRLPQNGELGTTANTYAKAVADAIGNTTAALTKVDSVKAGSYIITTIYIFGA